MESMNTLLSTVTAYAHYAWAIAFFAAFFETLLGVGLLFPGSTLLLFMGVLAGRGLFDVVPLFGFAFLGAYLGDNVNYWLGRRIGMKLLRHPWLHLSDSLIDKTERFLDRRGAISVFIARFVPGMKESISFVAGSVSMRYRTFLFWDTLGAMGWSAEFIGIGYLFSASLKLAELWLSRTAVLLLLLLFLGTVFYFVVRYFYVNRKSIALLLRSLARSLARNPLIRQWTQSHPKSVAFIKHRFVRQEFTGLPLTVLCLIFVYVAALFSGVVEDLITRDPIIAVDQIIATGMPRFRTPELTEWFTVITLLGRKEIVMLAALLVTVVLWFYRKRLSIVSFWFTLAGSIVTVLLTKLAFHRPRPATALYVEHTYAFPSGHAVVAVTLYGFAAFLLIRFSDNPRTKRSVFTGAFLLAGLIGLSRIYLGEHYLSDVYGGYLLGLLWLIAGIALTRWLEQRSDVAEQTAAGSGSLLLTATALFAVLFFLFAQRFHYQPVAVSRHAPVIIERVQTLFSSPHRRYVQSPLGFDAWPINIVIAADSEASVVSAFTQAHWHPASSTTVKMLPLFWAGRSADLAFESEEKGHRYFVKIFRTDTVLKRGKMLFVAFSGMIESMRCSIVPRFSPNIDSARTVVRDSLVRSGIVGQTVCLGMGKPGIGNDIMDEEYFTDGKIASIIIEKDQAHAHSAD